VIRSYGGVLIDARRRVLLREPANHFGGVVWTFAKGQPDGGETPPMAACREVLEETGWVGAVIARLPGRFPGSHTVTEYFLMAPVRKVSKPGRETARIRWVGVGRAEMLIRLGENQPAVARDLRVLATAFETLARLAHA